MSIVKFYENQEIFITGGGGFIGKALIEKLLRSCPNVSKIFLLLRAKKGQNADERLRKMMDSIIFSRIRDEQPKALKKVFAIVGDCAELGLGISPTDILKLQNVSIIFHVAATVRFNEPIRNAVLINTRGTYELIKIALKMQNLKSFVHVSTAFCNPNRRHVEEKVYPTNFNWRQVIKLAETFDEEQLNIFTKKYIDEYLNTYALTKHLSENIINEYNDKLPIVIIRPSVVFCAFEEPFPGWTEHLSSINGLMLGAVAGFIRVLYCKANATLNFVPIDSVARTLCIGGYKAALTSSSNSKKQETDVINCVNYFKSLPPTTNVELINLSKEIMPVRPFEKSLWISDTFCTDSLLVYKMSFILLQLIPAILLDSLLIILRKKPFIFKLQKTVYIQSVSMYNFSNHFYTFNTDKICNLETLLTKDDYKKFSIAKYSYFAVFTYIETCILGFKQYLLNEPKESSKGAKIRYQVFNTLDTSIKLYLGFALLQFIYKLYTMYF